MYTLTTSTLAVLARKAIGILNTLPEKRFVLTTTRDYEEEGVAYPVKGVCVPADGSGDIRFLFVNDPLTGCPWESLTITVDRAVESFGKQLKSAERRDDAQATLASEILILDSLLADYVSSREGSVRRVAKRLASILSDGRKGKVSFDWKSYDYDDDIPTICPYGTNIREKVQDVVFDADGTTMSVSTVAGGYYKTYHFDLAYDPARADAYMCEDALAFDESLIKKDIPDLLINIYYELPESYDIGDYELDFVKTC